MLEHCLFIGNNGHYFRLLGPGFIFMSTIFISCLLCLPLCIDISLVSSLFVFCLRLVFPVAYRLGSSLTILCNAIDRDKGLLFNKYKSHVENIDRKALRKTKE